ncbi:MAG: hypothetical protein AAF487_15155 [Bacteroidota bacterium]
MSLLCISSSVFNSEISSENPLKIVQYEEDNMIEIEPLSEVKDVLILNEKDAIVGHIERIENRMIIKTHTWPSGIYSLVYTLEGRSYRHNIRVK